MRRSQIKNLLIAAVSLGMQATRLPELRAHLDPQLMMGDRGGAICRAHIASEVQGQEGCLSQIPC
jgi:hypothetical protein